MAVLLVLFIIIGVIVVLVLVSGSSSSSSTATSTGSHNLAQRSSASQSQGDLYERARQADQLANQLARNSRTAVTYAKTQVIRQIEIALLNEQETLSQESERLERELQQAMSRRLESSKFHYYTQLHFSSMLAADQRYESYLQAKRALDSIGSVIVTIGKGQLRVSKQEKDYAYQLKDTYKACRDANLANTKLLNNQTHSFKIKIRDECGERGREWYRKIEANAKRRRQK